MVVEYPSNKGGNERNFKNKPLYEQQALVVREDKAGRPIRVGRLAVAAVDDQWRIDDEWWRQEPISRMYWAVILDNGDRLTIYRDLIKGTWHRQRY